MNVKSGKAAEVISSQENPARGGRVPASRAAEELAAQFSKELRETLTPQEMAKVNARNATPQYLGLCASHDFCDPNMAMLRAYSELTGVGEDSVDLNGVIGLMDEAWGLAKHSNFRIDRAAALDNTTDRRQSLRELLRECLRVLEELNSAERIAALGPAWSEMTQRSKKLEAELRGTVTLTDESPGARGRAADVRLSCLSADVGGSELRYLALLPPPSSGAPENVRTALTESTQEEIPTKTPAALTALNSIPTSLTDDDLRARWRAAGGSFHGPNVETGTMPEVRLLQFLRSLSPTYRDVVTLVVAALKASHPDVNPVTNDEFGHEATRTMHTLIRWELASTLGAANSQFDQRAFLEACRLDPKVSGDPDEEPEEENTDGELDEADPGDEEPILSEVHGMNWLELQNAVWLIKGYLPEGNRRESAQKLFDRAREECLYHMRRSCSNVAQVTVDQFRVTQKWSLEHPHRVPAVGMPEDGLRSLWTAGGGSLPDSDSDTATIPGAKLLPLLDQLVHVNGDLLPALAEALKSASPAENPSRRYSTDPDAVSEAHVQICLEIARMLKQRGFQFSLTPFLKSCGLHDFHGHPAPRPEPHSTLDESNHTLQAKAMNATRATVSFDAMEECNQNAVQDDVDREGASPDAELLSP